MASATDMATKLELILCNRVLCDRILLNAIAIARGIGSLELLTVGLSLIERRCDHAVY